MDRHLVAIEIGVERTADQRVDPDRLPLHEDRLKGLDSEPVQRRSAVQQHGMLADDLFEVVPHFGTLLLHELARLLDRCGETLVFQPVEQEGLEEFERHLLGKTALMDLQLRTDHDDGAAGVVHTLAEQVLAEPALLALEGVGEGLERAVVRALENASAAAVVEKGVHGFLQHALLVPNDHVRRAQLEQSPKTIVAVDDLSVELVEIARRETSAIEGNQRTKVRRDHRDDVHDHPLGEVPGLAERIHDLQPFRRLRPLLDGPLVPHGVAQLDRQGLEIRFVKQLLGGAGSHSRPIGASRALQLLAELVVGTAEEALEQAILVFGYHLALAKRAEPDVAHPAALVPLVEGEREELLQ